MKDDPSFIIGPQTNLKTVFLRVYELVLFLLKGGSLVQIIVKVFKPRRTLRQNARCWAMLTDISEQIPWMVNDELVTMCAADWKDVLTASLRQEMRIARGIDGGIVLLGLRTSGMTVETMSELIELMLAFGNERGVKWGDDAKPEALPAPKPDPAEVEAIAA